MPVGFFLSESKRQDKSLFKQTLNIELKWVYMVHDEVNFRAFVNTVMDIQVQ